MNSYKGLQKLLESVIPELGYEFCPLNDNNSNKTTVLIRNLSKNFLLRWNIENTLLFSQEIPVRLAERIKTLFFNRIWISDLAEINYEYLQHFVSENFINENPEYRILAILEYISNETDFAGERINISIKSTPFSDEYWRKMFFYNIDEFMFFLEAAQNLGYIEILAEHNDGYSGVRLTIEGVKSIIKIENERNSKECFVAMSFDPEMFKIYNESIRPAIIETGFEPIIISEKKDIPSDTTINDAILAAIKKSKFTIADFTNHKPGVYFESGYALGRGQKVIYTCSASEIGKAHFDTRNYPHIVWKDAEDLKRQLIDKIEVFIKS